MNKLLIVLASVLVSGSAFAQINSYVVQQQTGPSSGNVTRKNASLIVTNKFTVTKAQIVALGAATSGNVTIATLPAKAVILNTTLKHTVAVAGPSVSAATARITTAGHNYGTAFDVFQAVGNTVLDFDEAANSENFAAVTPVRVSFTSTGANLSVVTAGSVDAYITYYVRP